MDEELGDFVHRYIDFKVRREMHAALGKTVNGILRDGL